MKVTYDKKADAMYIYLTSPKRRVTKTEEKNGWIVDYAGKEVVGVEVLNASKVFGDKLVLKDHPSKHTPSFAHKIR